MPPQEPKFPMQVSFPTEEAMRKHFDSLFEGQEQILIMGDDEVDNLYAGMFKLRAPETGLKASTFLTLVTFKAQATSSKFQEVLDYPGVAGIGLSALEFVDWIKLIVKWATEKGVRVILMMDENLRYGGSSIQGAQQGQIFYGTEILNDVAKTYPGVHRISCSNSKRENAVRDGQKINGNTIVFRDPSLKTAIEKINEFGEET